MRVPVRFIALGLVPLAAALPMSKPRAAAPQDQPAASIFYPLLGSWKGTGQMAEAGQKPVDLALALSCVKASAGHAVSCKMVANNKDMLMSESDLFGVDPVTGKGHWYAVTNQGETHDHVATWIDAKTMKATHSWSQDGKKMHEDITMSLPTDKTMEFRGVVTADGKEASSFSGKLKR
jgi:hypothetical protein